MAGDGYRSVGAIDRAWQDRRQLTPFLSAALIASVHAICRDWARRKRACDLSRLAARKRRTPFSRGDVDRKRACDLSRPTRRRPTQHRRDFAPPRPLARARPLNAKRAPRICGARVPSLRNPRQFETKIASISVFTCSSVCSRAIAISFTMSERAVSSMRRSPNESCLSVLRRYKSRRTSATS